MAAQDIRENDPNVNLNTTGQNLGGATGPASVPEPPKPDPPKPTHTEEEMDADDLEMETSDAPKSPEKSGTITESQSAASTKTIVQKSNPAKGRFAHIPKFPDGTSFEEFANAKQAELSLFSREDAETIRSSISRKFDVMKKAGNFPNIMKIAEEDPRWKKFIREKIPGGIGKSKKKDQQQVTKTRNQKKNTYSKAL